MDGHKWVTGGKLCLSSSNRQRHAFTQQASARPWDRRAGRPSNHTTWTQPFSGRHADGAGGPAGGGHVTGSPSSGSSDPGQFDAHSLRVILSSLAWGPLAAAVPTWEGHCHTDGQPRRASVTSCQCQRQGSRSGDHPRKGPSPRRDHPWKGEPSTLRRDQLLEGTALGRDHPGGGTILWTRPTGHHTALTGTFSSHDTRIICTPGRAWAIPGQNPRTKWLEQDIDFSKSWRLDV